MKVPCDPATNDANVRKHGVSFDGAQERFVSDADCMEIFDDGHSTTEERYLAIGPIARGLVLVVWTEREDDVVRIISARWATPRERTLFAQFREGRP